jgi:hypothetical protein
MKKVLIITLIIQLILIQVAFAEEALKTPCLQKSLDGKTTYVRLCNSVEDIICKDVKISERRSCNENDQDVFRKNLKADEVFGFVKSCFGAAATSFKEFFTVFIPELLKGIWDITKATAELANNSVTGDGPNFWDKIKGSYESVSSIASDVYEAASSNPSAFISKLMNKISEAVGPLVANFDCLKPDLKVEKVCGFVGEWVLPPVMLAKMLVKGTKLLKKQAELYGFAKNEKKMAKYAKAMENLDEAAMKQMQFEEKYKSLGYTKEEYDQIIKLGNLKNIKVEDLNVTTSLNGRQQKLMLLGQKEKVAIVPAKKLTLTSDNFTIVAKRADGTTSKVPGQIIGKTLENDGKIIYHLRIYDPKTGLMKDAKLSGDRFANLSPIDANADEVSALMSEGYKMNPKIKTPEQEYLEAEKAMAQKIKKDKEAIKPIQAPEGMTVTELAADDPRVLEAFKHEGGIDFVPDPKSKNLVIIKEPEAKRPSMKPKPGKHIVPHIESDYITLQTKNSMGITSQMNAVVLKTENINGIIKYVIKVWDNTSQTFVQKSLSANELVQAGAKASKTAEKEIIKLKPQSLGERDINF